MNYRELMEKYKRQELGEEEQRLVEADIERQDAISEYLTEKLEEELDSGRETLGQGDDCRSGAGGASVQEKKFEAYVRKAIRRSFCRMGLAVLAVLLCVVLFIQFGLSSLVSRFYYDPGKEIMISHDNGGSYVVTNRMSRDLSVYSEVFLPGKKRDSVRVIELGYGKYAVTLNRTVTYAGTRQYGIGGQITRGRMELYDPDYLSAPSPNLFACYGLKEGGSSYQEQLEKQKEAGEFTWYYDGLDTGREAVENLEDGKLYLAYITLNRRLDFSEMNGLIKRMYEEDMTSSGEIWQGVCVSGDNVCHRVAGYHYCLNDSGLYLSEEEKEKYPELSLEVMGDDGWIDWSATERKQEDETVMETHFKSMLQYILDQEDFLEMTGRAAGEFAGQEGLDYVRQFYSSAIQYIEENGLTYYGAVCLADREEMLKMLEDQDILSVVALECG